MEFNDLLTLDDHEAGAEIEILAPNTGKPTGFFIKILGPDSMTFQKSQKKLRNQAIKAIQDKKSITEEDEIQAEIDQLAEISIGWRGITNNGKEKEFTRAACRELYTKSPGVRQQVDKALIDRTNFTKG